MLSIIPPIFLLLELMDVWVPKETIMKLMGKGAGIKGGASCLCLGFVFIRPVIRLLPCRNGFSQKRGFSDQYLYFSRRLVNDKVPMMLFEITQLEGRFALIRFGLNLIAILVLAVTMEKTTSKKETEAMYELASQQAGED